MDLFEHAQKVKERERARAYMAKRRREKPDEVRAINAKHRAKPESRKRAAELSRQWHSENRGYANEWRAIRFERGRQERPWAHLFGAVKARAKKRNIPFTLTPEWVTERWTGKCELTGLPFVISPGINHPHPFSPSFDRIVPTLGYVPGNTRIILMAVNLFKHINSDDDMYRIAEALLKNRATSSPIGAAIG